MVQAGNTILPPLMRVSSLYKGGNSQPRLSAIHPFNHSTKLTPHPTLRVTLSHSAYSLIRFILRLFEPASRKGERNIIPSHLTLRLFNQNYPSPALRALSPSRGEGTIIFTPHSSPFAYSTKITPHPTLFT